ncbi:hypothetical protein ACQUQU_00420 [Thalassolituus sp. LLYu03]|uniref:hypothetical protein n=1 Tax=Thalassolituus sp. LLYu03 TaxID=3421656 RepID=UPI003D2D23BF
MNPALHAPMQAGDARALLGTLSQQPQDVRAAFAHRYQQCLAELAASPDDDERLQLEAQLLDLSRACRTLLSPDDATAVATEAGSPKRETPKEEPPEAGLTEAEPTAAAADDLAIAGPLEPATESTEPAPQPPAGHSALHIAPSGAPHIPQHIADQTAEPADSPKTAPVAHKQAPVLLAQPASMGWLLPSAMVALFAVLLTTGSLFFLHLKQQINALENVLNRQTDQLVAMQQMHQGERRQWMSQMNLQQNQLREQQITLNQQTHDYSMLQQQLAATDKALAVERLTTDTLNDQIARLSRVSTQLIVSLCEDSARLGPAVGLSLKDEYMRRCQQSWRLAAE